MIKTVVIPKDNTLHLSIPNKYVGKEIEVFLYAKDELLDEQPTKPKKASCFKGLLTNQEADLYHAYLKHVRNEWDRNI